MRQGTGRRIGPFALLSISGFVFFLFVYLLPPPLPIRPETHLLDPSWQIILTEGFLRSAQFGRDIVYTYGPWGFLESPRGDPRIYPWLLSARLLIALAFVCGVSWIAVRRIRGPVDRYLYLLWIALLSDPIAVLPVILLAVGETSPIVHLLAIACALTMWVKFTSFVMVGALIAVFALQDLLKRRWPAISLEILGASLAFWLLAGQGLSTLPNYLQGALSMSRSYGAEMFVDGTGWELVLVAVLLFAFAIPLAALVVDRRAWFLWPSIGWVGLLFFLQLKEAFVRYDSYHIWLGIIDALLPCALILICRAGFFDSEALPARLRVPVRACAAWVVFLSVAFPVMEFITPGGLERVRALGQRTAGLRALPDYGQELREFRRIRPLREVAGTADFFPDEQAMIYGNSLRARLPPVPQAFAAYNRYLTGLNAAFFRGPGRPDFVFFDVWPIDGRYPSSSDTLSWLALLDCYEAAGNSGRYLVLHAAGCRESPLQPVGETRTRAGQQVTVPQGSAVWVQIDIRPNRMGKILALAARPPVTELEVGTGAGRRIFRLSPEAAGTGFLLSPLILRPADFGRLLTDGGMDPAEVVRDFRVVQSAGAQRFFEREMDVRFYALSGARQIQAVNSGPLFAGHGAR